MTDQSAEKDSCRVEMVDGEPVRVHGSGAWDDKDRDAFAEVVRAVRRLMDKPRSETCDHDECCRYNLCAHPKCCGYAIQRLSPGETQ